MEDTTNISDVVARHVVPLLIERALKSLNIAVAGAASLGPNWPLNYPTVKVLSSEKNDDLANSIMFERIKKETGLV